MTPRKIGLGKGLDALIPADEDQSTATGQGITTVPIESIEPNPHQPRSPIREQDLVELAASIEAHGVIQPLVVAEADEGYQLIAGERRWRASRLAGLDAVPVVIKDVAPEQMLALALVENVQRSDLNAIEEALAYRQLTEEFGLTQAEVAQQVGKSRSAVANTLRLLSACHAVQEAVMKGRISEGHARALIGLSEAARQENALSVVLKKAYNVRQTEAFVRRLQEGPVKKKETRPRKSPQTVQLEDDFRRALASEVSLTRKQDGGGRLIVRFEGEEDLERIYARIVGDEA